MRNRYMNPTSLPGPNKTNCWRSLHIEGSHSKDAVERHGCACMMEGKCTIDVEAKTAEHLPGAGKTIRRA